VVVEAGPPIVVCMAKVANKTPRTKLTRAEKKTRRAAKRQRRKDTFRSFRQTFGILRRNDKRLIPYLIGSFLLGFVILWLLFMLLMDNVWMGIFPGVMLGLLAALIMFSRRADRFQYAQADGQPGAAAYFLRQLKGDWRVKEMAAGNTQLDAVHRVLGRPGVILVAEGSPNRVRGLLAQEKKRVSRLAGDTPIYDVVIGHDEGQIPLKKLNLYLRKLPRNLAKAQVGTLERRLAVLDNSRTPLPQGPMPSGAKMRNLQRTVRRRS